MTRPGARPRYTIHVGNDASFVALYTGPDGENADAHFEEGEPINHVGVQTDDLDAIEDKVIAEGLIPFSHGDHAPRAALPFLRSRWHRI